MCSLIGWYHLVGSNIFRRQNLYRYGNREEGSFPSDKAAGEWRWSLNSTYCPVYEWVHEWVLLPPYHTTWARAPTCVRPSRERFHEHESKQRDPWSPGLDTEAVLQRQTGQGAMQFKYLTALNEQSVTASITSTLWTCHCEHNEHEQCGRTLIFTVLTSVKVHTVTL